MTSIEAIDAIRMELGWQPTAQDPRGIMKKLAILTLLLFGCDPEGPDVAPRVTCYVSGSVVLDAHVHVTTAWSTQSGIRVSEGQNAIRLHVDYCTVDYRKSAERE